MFKNIYLEKYEIYYFLDLCVKTGFWNTYDDSVCKNCGQDWRRYIDKACWYCL